VYSTVVISEAEFKRRGDSKTVRNTIVLTDSSEKQEDVIACREADSKWEAAED
jgi:hypothetical protein